MATKVALTANVLTELVAVPVSKAVFFSKKSACTNRRRLGSYEPTAFMHVEHQYKRREQGVDIVGYVDHKLGATIEFWLEEDGKVAEIRLDDTNID